MIYGRRVTGSRQRVNWYRGSPTRTSALPGSFDESTTGPTQKTHYDNTEDTSKDPDNPAADGAGSRHNYTVIGQTGLTYDNNRNVLADGTREFRYSYNNQLRRVWRKSDGQGASNGLLAKYREDAFGRRVYAESYWELSRRDVMDTRFSVDVNVDADGDGNAIIYLNGGITSTVAAPPGQTDQRAEWDSRIRRPITITNEAHYFDFDVTVPTGNAGEYLGFIAYDRFELRIYQNRYELWDSAGPTLIGQSTATTVGRHNIGLRAGQGWGVWVDGTQLTLTGDEVVSEATLSQLETLSAVFAAAAGLFALPQAADDFVRALSSFKNRASAAKAATNAAADTASNRGLSGGSSTLGTPTSVPTGGAAAASASKGTSGATSAVPTSQGIAQSARNTVQHLREKYKGLLQHLSESDLKGAAREVKGCLKGNHRQEVTEALTGVEGQIVRLERLLTQEYWTRDPIRLANIHDELQFLYSVRSRAMSALRGRHKVHG